MERSSINGPIQHIFKKKRRTFCQNYSFNSVTKVDVEILPDPNLASNFSPKLICDAATQFTRSMCQHEANVEQRTLESCGVNHVEGGWPKDILHTDLEQTIRFRKKTEKDEAYLQIILQLGNIMEQGIQQNNAINIYEDYFNTSECIDNECPKSLRMLGVLREPTVLGRAATCMSWTPNKKLAVAYSNTDKEFSNEAYVWDIGECPVPEITLQSPSCPVCLEFNPKDPHVIVGGCTGGQVVYWDIRRSPKLVDQSKREEGHQDAVQSVVWLNAKTGTEFFSASIDGQICWWDIRKLSVPADSLILDPTRGTEGGGGRPFGATRLEFEPTMSTKFMVGTELGTVFLCNAKAKSIQEKLAGMYNAHLGQIQALQRNPMFPKNFLTVGDWTAKVWSEEVREAPILNIGYQMTHLTAGCWSPLRPSILFATSAEGRLLSWDLLVSHQKPIINMKVMDSPLCSVRIHEGGRLIACGAEDGGLALVELGEEFAVLSKNDKSLLTMLFDRETKREKILESRSREQKLQVKIPNGAAANDSDPGRCEQCMELGLKYEELLQEESLEIATEE